MIFPLPGIFGKLQPMLELSFLVLRELWDIRTSSRYVLVESPSPSIVTLLLH
jgi:hypothetical protein